MPAVVTTLIHGPTLDQLSNWSATLDALPWSLDDAIWPEADLCSLEITEGAASSESARVSLTAKRTATSAAVSSEKAIPLLRIGGWFALRAQSSESLPSMAIPFTGQSSQGCVAVLLAVSGKTRLDGSSSETLRAYVVHNGIAPALALASELCASGIIFTRSGALDAESGESLHGSRLYTIWLQERGYSAERCVGRVIINAWGVGRAGSGQEFYGELRGHGWVLIPWDTGGSEWRERDV
jgi:hypothetical protein